MRDQIIHEEHQFYAANRMSGPWYLVTIMGAILIPGVAALWTWNITGDTVEEHVDGMSAYYDTAVKRAMRRVAVLGVLVLQFVLWLVILGSLGIV